MKILQVVHGFPPEFIGGTELYCEAIGRGLASRGHTCFILAGTQESRSAPELVTVDRDGLMVTRFVGTRLRPNHWSPSLWPEAERLILRYLKAMRPDVIHVQHWPRLTSNLVALSKSLGIPTIITLHDLWATCPRGNRLRSDRVFCTDPVPTAPCLTCVPRMEGEKDEDVAREMGFRQRLIADELRLADRVLVPSSAQKAFLAQLLGDQGTRMHVLPPGRIRSLNCASSPAASARPLRVGYWGSLAWWKGPHLLLEALHHLPDPSMVEAHLFGLPSEPEYGRQLEALAEGLSVVFHGKFRPSDLQRQALHLAVFPSLCYESYSFALDEAFQLGLPVIVPDRGAPTTRVGSAGLTFKVGDEVDLASKICSVLEEPGVLERLRRGQSATTPPSLMIHVGQLEGIYSEVVAALEVFAPAVEMVG